MNFFLIEELWQCYIINFVETILIFTIVDTMQDSVQHIPYCQENCKLYQNLLFQSFCDILYDYKQRITLRAWTVTSNVIGTDYEMPYIKIHWQIKLNNSWSVFSEKTTRFWLQSLHSNRRSFTDDVGLGAAERRWREAPLKFFTTADNQRNAWDDS